MQNLVLLAYITNWSISHWEEKILTATPVDYGKFRARAPTVSGNSIPTHIEEVARTAKRLVFDSLVFALAFIKTAPQVYQIKHGCLT